MYTLKWLRVFIGCSFIFFGLNLKCLGGMFLAAGAKSWSHFFILDMQVPGE